jgi:sigma-B regulation protein RsbU (phosphoserine phosphatase)
VTVPVVYRYQQALDTFRRAGEAPPLLKRMSELISLLDLTTTLNSSLSRGEILDAALLIVMGETQSTRGCLYVAEPDGYRRAASRGLPPGAPEVLRVPALAGDSFVHRASGALPEVFGALGVDVLCPVQRGERSLGLLGLGPRADGGSFADDDSSFLRSVAVCAATPIENGLMVEELRRVNQRLSVKVFQLRNLFDISRELSASPDEESVHAVVASSLMGHLMVARCAIYLEQDGGLALAHQRGIREALPAAVGEAGPVLDALRHPGPPAGLPEGELRARLQAARLALGIPMWAGDRVLGFIALGERLSGAPFADEDVDFALTLGRQAVAALDNLRMQRMRDEKQRRDREMQIAREIQQSLFPSDWPRVPQFEIAALSEPCYEVGGDHYDVIELPGGRLALAIADVSGKGTPASIIMASVHASLRALAGMAPEDLLRRLNRFLVESTQSNRFVTLFYAELDPATRRLRYVNAGHIPPWVVGPSGPTRLREGGPVLGLLDDVRYPCGEIQLQAGDLVAVVTDGVTEALSPDDEEFGDERVLAALDPAKGADDALRSLVETARSFAGTRGCADDLTALVLKATQETS